MQISDVIADMLTRIRNANNAKHETVDIPASNMKKAIAQILVDEAPDANLKPEFVKKSMQVIVDGQYWGDPAKIKDGSFVLGTNDFKGAQEYFDFLAEEDAYTDSHDKIIHEAPQAKDLATDEFIGK